MADLGTVVAYVVLGLVLRHHLKEFLCAQKVLLDEDLGMVVCTLGALLAVAVHVVPAKFAHYVL